ncbi:hypothetical protein [Sphingomonas sp. NFR15]|uniref:hypothetical protein n=1 Tax=Sphingomonas sp. NFR15 TaxID=1566282 RepID=UPI000888B561|nr:hypothetical protein [Sphingomonas sp. NFR15]SDA13358.1 hypothetical protein SAMN03159340_00404 [Sphingomonas sp. NFR15]
MEFVLFLCAALSALTGAITGTRAPAIEVQIEHVSVRAGVIASVAARPVAAIVQAQRVPAIGAVLAGIVTRAFALSAPVPLFAGRRRE